MIKIKYPWDIEEEEEKEEPKLIKFDWDEPQVDVGVDVKDEAIAPTKETLPETQPLTLRMLYSLNLNYNPPSSKPMEKIKRYDIDIKKLEKEAEISGGLTTELHSAYEQIIEKYNKVVKEYNVNLPLIEGLPKSLPSDKPLIEGLPISKPEDKPEGLFEDPKMIELQKVNFQVLQQWFKELKESKDKWAFLKGKDYSPELVELKKEYAKLTPYMYGKSEQWIQATSLAGIAVGLAYELIPLVAKATPEMIRSILYKVGIKDVSKKELHTALYNVTKGTDTPIQRRIFDEFIKAKELGVPFAERLKGIKLPTVTPRFAFGTKLYSGLPADEIIKSLVTAGRVTAEMVKGLDPAKLTQVYQQLLSIEPTLAGELVRLMPEVDVGIEPEVPDLTKELAGRMTKERIFLEEIEEAVGQKIDVKKPEDIKIALDYIKKVKPEVKEAIPKVEVKEPKINPMAFSSDPIAISRELESYPDDSVLIARKAELIFEQHLKGEEIDYPINHAEQELKLAKTNIKEKFGNDYPEAEKIIKRAEALKEELKVKPKLVKKDIVIEDDYKLIDKWIKANVPKVSVSGHGALKEVSELIREGKAPKDVLEAMHRQFEKTKDQETGEILWWDDEAYPRTGTLMDFYNAYENLDIIPEAKVVEPAPLEVPRVEVKAPIPEVKPIKPYVLKKELTKEQKIEGNKLIGQIHKIVSNKGLTKVEFTALKRKYGLSPHLATDTRIMTTPQLQAVLKAVEKARPKIIGYRKVVTLKTEGKILSLKDNLIDKLQMTEEVYKETLKDVGVYKEPKYIDAKSFITEEQGKKIIYRLIDEANILRVTVPFDRAVTENKPIKSDVDKINIRIKSEGARRVRDPHELNSMRVYAQKMETTTGTPIYTLYQDLIDAHLENKQKLSQFIKGFNPYEEIIKNENELRKVNDYIFAKSNLKDKPSVPENMTDKEIKLAKKIEGILKDYEARARTEKFLDNIDHPEDMPQYREFKKEIDKAKDIYESKGYDDLIEYMKGQKWGVIKSGYSPLQVISPRIRLYKPKPQTFGKTHIKTRTDIEYHEQDRNIMQRLYSYKKQMDNLVVMRPKVRALITLMDKDLDKFKDPPRISRNMEAFFRELKGYNRPENWFDRGLNRLYAQAMQTIIMPSPVLSGRNLLQNIAFGHDKSLLIDPRNKSLTREELDYFDTYISQLQAMNLDWFMTGEKPLPGLAILTKMVRKIGIYPYSDLANRHWGYWAKINQIKRAFARDVSLNKKMKAAKFSDMELIEQKMALQILAKDGKEAMARYVARVYVDNTQFLYDRSQRSLAEMGRVGRWAGNLMLFPRAYWEMLLKQSKKMTGKYVPGRERIRAFKVLAAVIGGGILVGAAYKKVTGRRENPYDPLVLLAYEPGGLAIGTVEAVTDVYVNILMASKGDDRALAALTTAIPKAADMFIPFYSYVTRAFEASTDTKNIDRKALRKIRMLIDNEYRLREGAYILERNAMEKWQYFLSGAGVDVEIKERLKGKPAPSIKYEWEKTKTKPKSIIKFDWE